MDRDDWDRGSWSYDHEWVSFRSGRSWPRRYLDENEPNSTCPVCGEAVWFFRNENGGCAYFDEIGKPWPKHPCMDSRLVVDRTAAWQARVEYRTAFEEEDEDIWVRDANDAYTAWALALLRAHTLELDVRKAEGQVKRAAAAAQQAAKRRATMLQRRERVRQLRERLRELKSELRDARAATKSAQVQYERELAWFEQYGS